MATPPVTCLKSKIEIFDEQEFFIPSNDLFRPPLKQIGRSVHERKEHFVRGDGLSVVPSTFQSTLYEIKNDISKLIKDNNGFRNYDFLIGRWLNATGEEEGEPNGFVFFTNSLSVVLDFRTLRGRPDDVICDVIIVLPYQPALVLTIVNDKEKEKEKENENITYNTSVARGVCMSLGRFMDEGFKTAFGVVRKQDLKDGGRFRTQFEDIITASGKFVTYSSLSMNPEKYEKVLTAFWASISETKSVFLGSKKDDSLRFLTKDQCVVLVENINEKDVSISSGSDTGSTVLMAEAARRLSHLGNTLLICEKQEDCDKYSDLHPMVTTCYANDLGSPSGPDLRDFKCVVDDRRQTRNQEQSREPVKGICWVHYSLPDAAYSKEDKSGKFGKHPVEGDEEMEPAPKRGRVSVSDQLMEMSLGPQDEGNSSIPLKKECGTTSSCEKDIQQETECDDDALSFTISAGGKKINVMCSPMAFDKELVNTKHCHISDMEELVNSPGKADAKGRKGYKRYWGTKSTFIIPAFSTTPTPLTSQYWEVNADIQPKDSASLSSASSGETTWGPLFEFGVVEKSKADNRVWMSQDKRFWCLSVDGCKSKGHFGRYCTHIISEMSTKEDDKLVCHPEMISSTGPTQLGYGVIVDVEQDMAAFIDLKKEIALEVVRADFKENLLPMFAVKHITKNVFNIKLKLISGKEIEMTDTKKKLIGQCYQQLSPKA